ncbi:uncharacterized protein LOC124171491 [Ischnura elegans]|uniref:uncharacterized protein LOC124171491 n=1 Tax=Ischnura elegans TaxID=197161 RepID=UPI001ED8AB19|nr:uncharacterized protein LOC124171491 [Ischnura elegans]XP_046406623.1 uncharacterized protein LOC124171491 [Ischnura elegans]
MKKSSRVRDSDYYLPCSDCLGFYARRQLWRHRKHCVENPSNGSIRSTTQIKAQNYLIKNFRVDPKLHDEVFPRMRPDKISLVAKKDALICAFGARYFKIHREKHFVNVTSRKMRELAKLLIEIRKIEPIVKNLFQALQPQYYDAIVEATKNVARYDSNKDCFESPTYAMNMGTSLKQCCDIAIMFAIKKKGWYANVQSAEAEADLKTMIQLLTANWKYDISNHAADNLCIKRWNKVKLIPLASDLKLLKNHLTIRANNAASNLMLDKTDETAFCELLETIYCRVLLLNRKRAGELQRILLHVYEMSESICQNYEEFDSAISLTEKVLMKRFKRIIIRGKRNRGVPVLFSLDVQEHIKLLLSVRSNFVGDENPFLFGKPHLKTPLCGYKTLEKYAKACRAANPKAITSTRLRKHLATISQIFNMTDNDIEQLATFVGHTAGIHKQSYRLPDDVYQTAKISKILLLMEKGEAADFKGKNLDEIDINLEEELPLQGNSTENADDDFSADFYETDESFSHGESAMGAPNILEPQPLSSSLTFVEGKRKRILVPWTQEQKDIVNKYFKNHIIKKIAPKRKECEALIKENPDVLHNKSWLKIKVFIQNAYSKK